MKFGKLAVATLTLAAMLVSLPLSGAAKSRLKPKYTAIEPESIRVGGELRDRLLKNLERLESEKYQPDHVFLTEAQSGGWPGDTEGRAILGIVMDARASGQQPKYLDEIIRRVPSHLNERGYMGFIHPDSLDEQQLSGHGWLLRGLCEYYLWRGDKSVMPIIRSVADSLFLDGQRLVSSYPITPESRKPTGGGASGNIAQLTAHWRLSTDIGCIFIGMDGLLQALQVTGEKRLHPLADELVQLFLQVDLTGIKAQTHASLTGMRGLIRYADITGDSRYIAEAAKRWKIYKEYGMTELYGNYNWFCRYNTWTEPCAIVDAFMVAMQLWQHTGKAEYRDDAELIYYNALCMSQRANGGFGTDNNPGKAMSSPSVSISGEEATWCCTMRGGEGLGRAAQYTAYTAKREIDLAFLRPATITSGKNQLEVRTGYPFSDGGAEIVVTKAAGGMLTIGIAKPAWAENYSIKVNGKPATFQEADGLAKVKAKFRSGDKISVDFTLQPRYVSTLNKENTSASDFKVAYGPLVLACPIGVDANVRYGEKLVKTGNCEFRGEKSGTVLTPIYHLLDPAVSLGAKTPYKRRVLFSR